MIKNTKKIVQTVEIPPTQAPPPKNNNKRGRNTRSKSPAAVPNGGSHKKNKKSKPRDQQAFNLQEKINETQHAKFIEEEKNNDKIDVR